MQCEGRGRARILHVGVEIRLGFKLTQTEFGASSFEFVLCEDKVESFKEFDRIWGKFIRIRIRAEPEPAPYSSTRRLVPSAWGALTCEA